MKLRCNKCALEVPATIKLCPRCHGTHFSPLASSITPTGHPTRSLPAGRVHPTNGLLPPMGNTQSKNGQTGNAAFRQIRILSRWQIGALLITLLFTLMVLLKTSEIAAEQLANRTSLEDEFTLVQASVDSFLANSLSGFHPDSQLVNQVGSKLVHALPDSSPYRQRYMFHVIPKPDVNAFAISGGAIFVYTGLLDLTQRNPDQIAAVLAHEIQHVEQRHYLQGLYRKVSLLVATLWTFGYSSNFGLLITNDLVDTHYSRKHEMEADELGAQLLEVAGYSRSAMVSMLRLLASQKSGLQRPEWVSSHPDAERRAKAIEGSR